MTPTHPPQPQNFPFILGLTGSIGMGKSTVSQMFRDAGVPVVDSDAIVHRLYAPGGAAVPLVASEFGNDVIDPSHGGISRPALSTKVVGDAAALCRLEAIVHPLVAAEKRRQIIDAAMHGASLVVVDIPLLYETGNEATSCDAVAVASAPAAEQRRRVLARPGMTPEKLDSILSRQLPDEEKRRRADFVIDTGVEMEETRAAVGALIDGVRGRRGRAAARMFAETLP